jgi:biopolymer transport protein ExbD
MKLPAAAPSRHREPVGPLIDIVFLLLVFFLLAGTLEPTPPVAVEPPEAAHGEAAKNGPLKILLDADGRVGFEGKVLDMEDLAAAVIGRIGLDGARTVVVEADGTAAVGSVFALLQQLRELGLEDIQLATRPLDTAPNEDA